MQWFGYRSEWDIYGHQRPMHSPHVTSRSPRPKYCHSNITILSSGNPRTNLSSKLCDRCWLNRGLLTWKYRRNRTLRMLTSYRSQLRLGNRHLHVHCLLQVAFTRHSLQYWNDSYRSFGKYHCDKSYLSLHSVSDLLKKVSILAIATTIANKINLKLLTGSGILENYNRKRISQNESKYRDWS